MPVVRTAGVEGISFAPVLPSSVLLDFEDEAALQYGPVGEPENLGRLRVAGSNELRPGFSSLHSLRGIDANQPYLAKAAAVMPERAQPANDSCLRLFVKRRRKIGGSLQVRIVGNKCGELIRGQTQAQHALLPQSARRIALDVHRNIARLAVPTDHAG